jgi:hypothetical protein
VYRGNWTEIKIRGEWKDGDVVGVACDLDEGSMRISRNGDFLPPNGGVVFGSGLVAGPLIGCFLFPAISGDRVRIKCNFGLQTFKHLPPAPDYLSFLESACPPDHKVFFFRVFRLSTTSNCGITLPCYSCLQTATSSSPSLIQSMVHHTLLACRYSARKLVGHARRFGV